MTGRMAHEISFSDDIRNFDFAANMNAVVHILCLSGSFSFTRNHIRFNVSQGDYVILTPGIGVTDVSFSGTADVLIMFFPEKVVHTSAIRSNYGVLGHLALIENPVLKLDPGEFTRCRRDMENLRQRVADTRHLLYEEMTGALLKAHILDLYDIHARTAVEIEINSRPARIMRAFVEMLINGDYTGSRRLDRYASQLCITPHYLTEISKKISGRPATYWIELFLTRAATIALTQRDRTLEEIACTLSFSSLSHFSRFIKSRLGITPTQFRNRYSTGRVSNNKQSNP